MARSTVRSMVCGVAAAVAVAWLIAASAHAATIAVNDTGTAVSPTDGHCTLIEAIASANANTASGGAAGECPAGEPDATATDLIVLQVGRLPTNALSGLVFTRLDNATVLVGGVPVGVGTPVTIPPGAISLQFVVRRNTAGQAATAQFTARDACGDWKSFAGGGPTAF